MSENAVDGDTVASPVGGERETLEALVAWSQDTMLNGGRFAVSVRADARGRLYSAPLSGPETFFSDATGRQRIEKSEELGAFLDHIGDEPLAYGYPIRVDHRGLITPLFLCDVEVERSGSTVLIRKAHGRRPRLHRRLLIEGGFDRASADHISDFLEHTGFESLADCLSQTTRILGLDPELAATGDVESISATPAPGWYRAPIVFRSPRRPVDARLSRDLDATMAAYRSTQVRTALDALVARQPQRSRHTQPRIMEVLPLSEDLPQVIDTATKTALSAIEAPPGTNRMGLLASLVATLAHDGQSVLFVSPSPNLLQQLGGRLQAMLARQERWMITLGADDLEERLAATLEAEARRGWEEGARRVTQRELNDAQEALDRLRQTVDPIRKGQALWTTRQRTRRSLEALVSPEWKALLDPEIPLRTDRGEIDRLREQAAALAAAAEQRGLSRLMKRGARDEALHDLAKSLERIVASIPRDKRMHVPVSVRKMAEAPDAPAQFLRFIDALGPVLDCRRAIVAEQQAQAGVARAPTGSMLDDQLTGAQELVVGTSRELFRDSMQATQQGMVAAGPQRVMALLEIMQARALSTGPIDHRVDSNIARQIGNITRNYPIWLGTPDNVSRYLPLVGGLFDMIVVDDADRLPAPGMVPLLLRGRHATVVGVSQPVRADQARTDGMIIAATARAVQRSTLTVNSRSHPLIVDYLSEVFHGGRLYAQARFGELRSGYPATVMGLHWHDVHAEQDVPGWETELAGAITLLHDWAEADVFEVPEPRTVGIVTPMRDNADVLGRHLEGMLPPGLPVERIAIGTPERFHGQAVDLMIVLPTLTAQMPDEQRHRLAADRSLYHDAVAAARIGVHVVGDAGICKSTGGLVAELHRHTQFPDGNPPLPEGHLASRRSEGASRRPARPARSLLPPPWCRVPRAQPDGPNLCGQHRHRR